MIRDLYAFRYLIRQFAWREVAGRYKGTYLGLVWSLIHPLMTLVVYTFVFGVILNVRFGPQSEGSQLDFALNLFCGLIVYNIFSTCVGRAPSLIVGNPNYVKRVVFPLEVLPVAILGSALVDAAIGLAVLVIMLVASSVEIPWTIVLFPLCVAPLCALSLGVAWFLTAIGVFLRDVGQAVTVGLQLLFFLSPVVYPLSSVPESLQLMVRLNPLTTILEGARRTVMMGLPPEWLWWSAVVVVSLVALQLGYAWFMRSKRGFADVV
jgi:lipopolysaccharide transport system permease protein